MHWLGYIIIIGLPLILTVYLFASASKWRREYLSKVLRCSVETAATVVDSKEEHYSDMDGTTRWFHPIVQFNFRGEEVRTCCEEKLNPFPFTLGDRVLLWYNPNEPSEVHLEVAYSNKTREYTVPVVIGMISGIITIICAIFCITY